MKKSNVWSVVGVIALVVLGVGTLAINSAAVGEIEGKPYSVKRTERGFFNPGTWVYYNSDGIETPLDCKRALFGVECSDGEKVKFSAHSNKSDDISFPSITVNGEERDIRCANRGFIVDCLTSPSE